MIATVIQENNLVMVESTIPPGTTTMVADRIEKAINFDKAKTICVFGLSYKPNVEDFRNSPSLKLSHILLNRGYTIIGCEPHIHRREIQGIKNFDIEEALGIADFGVITLSHDLFIKKKNIFKRILIYNCTELLF